MGRFVEPQATNRPIGGDTAAMVEEGEIGVDGVRVFYRRVEGEGTPVVYCHGNPTHGEDWLPFLERGGPAIAIDMPGWGRSDRPDPARFDYTMHGLSSFLDRCLDELGVERRKLVVHDWGGLALIGAQRRPDLVERLVVVNAVPLLPGYRWHWIAQLWRRRPIGEILNATTTRSSLALLMRQARGDRSAMPPEFVEMVWRDWAPRRPSSPSTETPIRSASPRPAASSRASPVPRSSSGATATPTCPSASGPPMRTRCPTPSSRSRAVAATGPGSTIPP
jgi:pimeloyl-ACP methyl ester carboxylesterase